MYFYFSILALKCYLFSTLPFDMADKRSWNVGRVLGWKSKLELHATFATVIASKQTNDTLPET